MPAPPPELAVLPVATGPGAPPQGRPRRAARVLNTFARRPEAGAAVAALLLLVFFSLWAPGFLTKDSLAATLTLSAELGIVAIAVTLLMIAGEFDLSVGSVLGLCSLLVPYSMMHWGVGAPVAVALALLAAALIGLIQGLLVTRGRTPSFIVTLAGLLFWRSLLEVVTKGFPVTVPDGATFLSIFGAQIGGFNVSALWFAGLAVVLSIILTQTRRGNWIFASGGNEGAARSMGIPVDRVRVSLFMLTAGAAALVGVIQAARFSTVDTSRGAGIELEAIAAVVIGGTRLTGGYGSVVGTVLGCLMIGMIRNGLVLGGVASYWYQGIIGLLLLMAVFVNQLTGKARAGG